MTLSYELSCDRSLPEEVEKFRNRIKSGLSDMLGMPESVEICVNLSGVKSGKCVRDGKGLEQSAESYPETESGILE